MEVSVYASYDFVLGVSQPHKNPGMSPYRTAVVKKYWQTVQGSVSRACLVCRLSRDVSDVKRCECGVKPVLELASNIFNKCEYVSCCAMMSLQGRVPGGSAVHGRSAR